MIVEERKTRRPSFQFYPGDWLHDTNLLSCSFAAQGLWIRLLCLMHFGIPYGHLTDTRGNPLSESNLRRNLGGTPTLTLRKLLGELKSNHVLDTKDTGLLFSRRMVRDEEKRLKFTEFGKKSQFGGGTLPSPLPRKSPHGSSSSSSSSPSKTTDSLEGLLPSEPAETLEPIVMTFPTVGVEKRWDMKNGHLNSLMRGFPSLDVLAECAKALAWCDANATRRKTPKGMPKFLYGWMERAQNKGGAAQTTQGAYDWRTAKPTVKN